MLFLYKIAGDTQENFDVEMKIIIQINLFWHLLNSIVT